MRRILFEILAVALLGAGLLFFLKCAGSLARRDYVSALVLLGIGFSVISVGKEMARLSLFQRS